MPPINRRDVFDIRWTVDGRTIHPVGKNIKVEDVYTKGLLTTPNLIANGIKTVGFWVCAMLWLLHFFSNLDI